MVTHACRRFIHGFFDASTNHVPGILLAVIVSKRNHQAPGALNASGILMHNLLRFGNGHLFKRKIRCCRHAPSGRLGNLRPHSFVRAKFRGIHFVAGYGVPAPEGHLGVIIGKTLREVHFPAVRVSHQVPAAVQAVEFPHDFAILGAAGFANHQRIANGRAVPESASGIDAFAIECAVLPVIAHRVTFIPPVERGIINLHLLLVEGGQRNHLPATRSGLDFGVDFKVFYGFGMSCTVVHNQDHLVLADWSRHQFPLRTANNRILKSIDPDSVFSANHQDACEGGFADVFGTEGQADCIVAGLFDGRRHNLDFARKARARDFNRAGGFFDAARAFGFARARNFYDATGGFFNRTRRFLDTAGAFRLARARDFDRARRFRILFVGCHDIEILDNVIEFTVPASKCITFAHRICRRHSSRAVFHHLNVTNLGFIVIQEGDLVQDLGRIVNSLIDGIALDLGHFGIPAHKGVYVFCSSHAFVKVRSQHNGIVFNGITNRAAVVIFKNNPVLFRAVRRLDIQVILDLRIRFAPAGKFIAFTNRSRRGNSRFHIVHTLVFSNLRTIVAKELDRIHVNVVLGFHRQVCLDIMEILIPFTCKGVTFNRVFFHFFQGRLGRIFASLHLILLNRFGLILGNERDHVIGFHLRHNGLILTFHGKNRQVVIATLQIAPCVIRFFAIGAVQEACKLRPLYVLYRSVMVAASFGIISILLCIANHVVDILVDSPVRFDIAQLTKRNRDVGIVYVIVVVHRLNLVTLVQHQFAEQVTHLLFVGSVIGAMGRSHRDIANAKGVAEFHCNFVCTRSAH